MVIDFNIEHPEQLNGFLGDIFQKIITPKGPSQSEETARLENELYFQQQELAKAKSNQTIMIALASIFGVATAYLGYKQFKK